jgi:hypothetical protein
MSRHRHGCMNRSLRRAAAIATSAIAAALLVAPSAARASCSNSICVVSASTCTITGTHTIDNACILDFSGLDATVAKGAKLTNADGNSYTVRAGSLTVRGELEAVNDGVGIGGGVSVETTGNFSVVVFDNSAAAVDVRQGGSFDATVGGATNLAGKQFDSSGSGGVDGGDITIDSTGSVTVSQTIDASGGGSFAFGGFIDITGSSISTTGQLKSVGTQEGDGGDITLTATGACTINGAINTSASGDSAFGGFITLDCGSVSTNSTWNSSGGSGGSGGDIDISTTGTTTTTSTSSWTCTAGGGGDGCWVTVLSDGSITADGDIDASASGTDAFGGSIDLDSGGDVTVGATSLLKADTGTAGFFDGDIAVEGCDVEIDGVLDTRTASVGGGTNTIKFHDSFDGTATTARADDPSGNVINCPCTDANSDQVCDTPLTCAVAPNTTGGSYQPTPVVTPILLPACQ